MDSKNYAQISKNGLFYTWYMFADIPKYMADDIFINHKLRVHFSREFKKEINGQEYVIIFCKIRKNKKQIFEECMSELKRKMLIFGYDGYQEACDGIGYVIGKYEIGKENT